MTADSRIPFFRHDLGPAELAAVAEVLNQPILTTGETVTQFEQRFAGYLGRGYAIGLGSATAALHLALTALGIGPGDEVVTTPLSFIATATAILQAGATPVFAEVEEDTGNIDVARIDSVLTSRTRAIIPVHLYGQMVDIRALRALADRSGLAIVEDAAHCIEGVRDGVRRGALSEVACFSFYATKNLTCGEGGAALTDDAGLARRLRLLSQHGMNRTAADRERHGYSHWDMELFGWKYNISNLQAAFLLPQFERLDRKMAARRELAARYADRLAGLRGIVLPAQRPDSASAWHLFVIRTLMVPRDEMILQLRQAGIDVVVNYRPIHLTSYFRNTFRYRPGAFPNAERWGETVLSLPFWPGMAVEAVDRVAAAIARIISAGADPSLPVRTAV